MIRLQPVAEPSNLIGSHKEQSGYGYEGDGKVPIHRDRLPEEITEADSEQEFTLAIGEVVSELHGSCIEAMNPPVKMPPDQAVGRRFLALVLVTNPSLLPFNFNASDLADLCGVTKAHISNLASAVTKRFGVTATFQRSREVRDAYRQAQLNRKIKKQVQVATPEPAETETLAKGLNENLQ